MLQDKPPLKTTYLQAARSSLAHNATVVEHYIIRGNRFVRANASAGSAQGTQSVSKPFCLRQRLSTIIVHFFGRVLMVTA